MAQSFESNDEQFHDHAADTWLITLLPIVGCCPIHRGEKKKKIELQYISEAVG